MNEIIKMSDMERELLFEKDEFREGDYIRLIHALCHSVKTICGYKEDYEQ